MSIPIPSRDEAEVIVAAMNAALAAGYSPMGTVAPKGTVSALIKVAEDRGISSHTLRHWVRADGLFERNYGLATDWKAGTEARKAARGEMGFAPVLPGYELARSSTQRDASGNTEREWITQKPAKGLVAEVPAGHVVKGVSILTDGEGRQVARWIKTRENDALDFVKVIKEAFESYRGTALPVPCPTETKADLMSVYPLVDQHNGLLAWGRETGESYDLKIGAARLRSCMTNLVAQSPASAEALIINLGDWQHNDDSRNVTPRGHNTLDVDGRYRKVLATGVQLMMDCISLALAKHQRVTLRNLPGNHDPHASDALTVALLCFYANEPRVTIVDDPSEWFFYKFGKTLIGAHHGHRAKPDRMAMMMATSCRQWWAETDYHWMLFGHIHHETAKEVGDVRCESFQTLASRDAFHAGAGYMAGRSIQSITLHVDRGEIGRHRINIPPVLTQVTLDKTG